MTNAEPLTRYLGKAERTLQALLQTRLRVVGITFSEWAVLTFLSGGPLTHEQLATAIDKGRVTDGSPANLIESMIGKGLVESSGERFVATKKGSDIFEPVRASVMKITGELEHGISENDLAATRRTLQTVSERADRMTCSPEMFPI
uniref:MarR family winged helix-turn-helix transcriptional regulator n=1 Tax=Nitratireductor soli TaxID=1670619 RepID=UPI000B06E81F